jgi:hypothetical protein
MNQSFLYFLHVISAVFRYALGRHAEKDSCTLLSFLVGHTFALYITNCRIYRQSGRSVGIVRSRTKAMEFSLV